jgi:hypothetical protein
VSLSPVMRFNKTAAVAHVSDTLWIKTEYCELAHRSRCMVRNRSHICSVL